MKNMRPRAPMPSLARTRLGMWQTIGSSPRQSVNAVAAQAFQRNFPNFSSKADASSP